MVMSRAPVPTPVSPPFRDTAPVVGFSENDDTFKEILFTTYAKRPEGSTATENGSLPAAAEPANVSAPALLMRYERTDALLKTPTSRNFPRMSLATALASPRLATPPGISLNAPVELSTE